jgi:hypothetical protein
MFSVGQITSFPYFENFTTPPANWTVTTVSGTAWEFGVPTAPGTIGAYSSPNCYGTDPDSGYRANTTSYLTSPRFDISTLTNPLFSFYQFRYLSVGLDGMHVEYSTDDITWLRLGTVNSASGFNWYNTSSIVATGLPAFTGNSVTWLQSGYYLNGLTTGLIRLRFVFRSNISFGSSQPGIFVDDIRLENSTSIIADVAASTVPGFNGPYPSGVKQALSMRLINFSSVQIDSARIGYLLNGNLTMNTMTFLDLSPGEADTFALDSVTLPAGNFIIKAFVAYPNDPNNNNDTILRTGTTSTFASLPYTDDFETAPSLWYNNSLFLTNWELGMPNFDLTTGTHSGINAWDINLDTSYYPGANSELISPIFSIPSNGIYELSFWHNEYLEPTWDGMRIDYSTNGGSTWTPLGYYGDPLGTNWYDYSVVNSLGWSGWSGNSNGWVNSRYKLSAFAGASQFQLKFVFTSDNVGQYDGISVDDFSILPIPDYEAVYISTNDNILNPAQGQSSGPINIKFWNNGSQPITTFTAQYTINGILQQSQLFNLTVLPGDTSTLTMPGFTAPTGVFTICGKIILTGDVDTTNNEGCFQTTSQLSVQVPYIEDFETPGSPGWYEISSTPGTNWEHGYPAFGLTTGTHSGSYCWDINLTTTYGALANSYLYSPSINLNTGSSSQLSFWMNIAAENSWDGTRLEYSTDGGLSWFILGYFNDPLGVNWYNDDFVNSSGTAGWTDNSNGWIRARYRLDLFQGVVDFRLRYVFTSDQSITTDGFSIDDFQVTPIPDFDAEVTNAYTLSQFPPIGYNTGNLKLQIANVGGQTFNGFNYSYSLNGSPAQTAFYPGTLNTFDTIPLTLPGFVTTAINNTICVYVNLSNDPNQSNDTLCFDIVCTPVYTPYFADDFDGTNLGWNQSNIGSSGTNWQLGTPAYGVTNSVFSAPNSWDINLSTAYTTNANTALVSPWFDLSNSVNPILSLMQNRHLLSNSDGFQLEFKIPGDTTWFVLGIFNDPSGTNWYNIANFPSNNLPAWTGNSNGWINSTIPISNLSAFNQLIQFRFNFISGQFNSASDGLSIDEFKIEVALANDADVMSIVSPGSIAIENSSTAVEVLLRNNGSQPLTALTFKYRHNGGPEVTHSWTGNLLYDSTEIVLLPSFLPTAGANDLLIYTDWASDQFHINDTLRHTFNAIATSGLPYSNDFESGNGFWTTENTPFSTWEYGSPTFAPTNTTHSGNFCWDINLSTPYGNIATSKLTSPIFDLGNNTTITISFWQNYATEFAADGLLLEYSTNGVTWQPLGTIGDPNGTNWYNATIFQGKEAWCGSSGGWVNSIYNYQKPWGNNFLQLRYVFVSDVALVNAGVSIDDINITGIVGLSENAQSGIIISPNPANDMITIYSSNSTNRIQLIQFFDATGKMLFQQQAGNESAEMLETSHLSSGIYSAVIHFNDGSRLTKKIAIQH